MEAPLRAPTLVPTIPKGPSTPASNSACRTPTCAAPLAPPPPSTQVRRADPNILVKSLPACRGVGSSPPVGRWCVAPEGLRRRGESSPLLPRREISPLLVRERVDRDAHRVQLEPRHLGVDVLRHVVNLLLEAGRVPGDVLRAKRLVGEAHVHHRRGMPLGPSQVDQPALAKQVEASPVARPVLLN